MIKIKNKYEASDDRIIEALNSFRDELKETKEALCTEIDTVGKGLGWGVTTSSSREDDPEKRESKEWTGISYESWSRRMKKDGFGDEVNRSNYDQWMKEQEKELAREKKKKREEELLRLHSRLDNATQEMMKPRDWAEQRDQARREEEMRDFYRRRDSGQLNFYERDYSRRKFVPGQGYVRTWRRPDEWTIVRVPIVGYRKVFRRG